VKSAETVAQLGVEEAFRLGLSHFAEGRCRQAAACFEQATRLCPELPEAWRNLGAVLLHQGLAQEAEPCLRRAIRLRPQFAEAYNDLGHCLQLQKRGQEAAECFRRALACKPTLAEAHLNLGNTLRAEGCFQEAAACYQQALSLRPGWAEAHCWLAACLAGLRRYQEAARHCRHALEAKPELAEAHNVLGVVAEAQGRLSEALGCYAQALKLRPQFPEALNNHGAALARLGRLTPAEQSLRAALAVSPDYAVAWNNLGHLHERRGLLSEALACYRRALRCAPGFALAHSNLLLALHYDPEATPEDIFAEHRRWAERHAAPLAGRLRKHANHRDPERELRVGYLSPDFRAHSVAYFIEPVLASHDRRQVWVICYSNSAVEDAVTVRLRALADAWRPVEALSDEQAAELIRRDEIDILVDLAGHTANGRPRLLALKPAPVQVNWLGYPDTTGLNTVDYRITDERADPPGLTDRFHTERLIRLPGPFLCYRPPQEAPPAAPPPALASGRISFGAFHNLAKINRQVIRTWAEILRGVPDSRLLVKNGALDEESARAHLRELFADCGLDPLRLELRGRTPGLAAHLAAYAEVDIGLDTFPYAGTTTTCEALWMGVPVVSLFGGTHASRTGLSLLSAVGLRELAADSRAAYIACAVRLAGDLARLAELRAGLRARMAQSPLTDAARFTRELEQAYRLMWRRWCEEGGS